MSSFEKGQGPQKHKVHVRCEAVYLFQLIPEAAGEADAVPPGRAYAQAEFEKVRVALNALHSLQDGALSHHLQASNVILCVSDSRDQAFS